MGVGGAMSKELIAIAMAAAGYTFTTWHERTVQQRAGRLERVNQQVRLLYGPLLACVNSSKAAFEAMVRQHSHASSSDTFSHVVRSNPRGPEAEAYRKWMVEVLQPLNERAAELIFKHSDLLDSSTINPILLQFISHVAANRVMLKEWGRGNVEAFSQIPFPDDLIDYAREELGRVKALQAQLLGIPEQVLAGEGQGAPPPRSKL